MLNFKTPQLQYGGWLYLIFFWVSLAAALVLNIWVQLPGYAIAFMAVAAFIATFRDEIPNSHKLVWCVAVCGLFVAEIRAIKRDKEEQAKVEASRRNEEDKKFADNIQKLEETLHALGILRSQTDAQEMWTKQILAKEFEKGQFAYARASGFEHPSKEKGWNLELMNSGDAPLYEVNVMVLGTGLSKPQYYSLQTLPSSKGGPSSTNIRVPIGFYLIELSSRHSEFQEMLKLLPDEKHPGNYIQKISVKREFDNKELWQCCPPKDCINEHCTAQ
jgi:hypothetical protein